MMRNQDVWYQHGAMPFGQYLGANWVQEGTYCLQFESNSPHKDMNNVANLYFTKMMHIKCQLSLPSSVNFMKVTNYGFVICVLGVNLI